MTNKNKCPNCGEIADNLNQNHILDWFKEENRQHVTIQQVAEEFDMSNPLAWKYLEKLELEGHLFKHKIGKKVNYCLIN